MGGTMDERNKRAKLHLANWLAALVAYCTIVRISKELSTLAPLRIH